MHEITIYPTKTKGMRERRQAIYYLMNSLFMLTEHQHQHWSWLSSWRSKETNFFTATRGVDCACYRRESELWRGKLLSCDHIETVLLRFHSVVVNSSKSRHVQVRRAAMKLSSWERKSKVKINKYIFSRVKKLAKIKIRQKKLGNWISHAKIPFPLNQLLEIDSITLDTSHQLCRVLLGREKKTWINRITRLSTDNQPSPETGYMWWAFFIQPKNSAEVPEISNNGIELSANVEIIVHGTTMTVSTKLSHRLLLLLSWRESSTSERKCW